jgi:transcription antitermination factor NusG
MTVAWYALNSQPRKEEFLFKQCTANQYEAYYPRIRVHPVNPRSRKFVPYFPGYIFVHVDFEELGISIFKWMPGAKHIVSYDNIPASIPDGLIKRIQQKVYEINEAGGELFDSIKPGDKVYIQDGPFQGYEAIFDSRLTGSERVRVLLKFIENRQVPIELSVGQIRQENKR